MNTARIALVLLSAAAFPLSAQDRGPQPLEPLSVEPGLQYPTVQQLARETGLSAQHVRMVLGSRTDHGDYRISYDREAKRFREALGQDRYRELIAGRPIELRSPEALSLVATGLRGARRSLP